MAQRLYDFICNKCEKKSEQWADISKQETFQCEECKDGQLERCFPSPAFKMPRETQHGFDGNGAKVKFAEAGRYNPKTGKIDT